MGVAPMSFFEPVITYWVVTGCNEIPNISKYHGKLKKHK